MKLTDKQIRATKKADLYSFLRSNHAPEIRIMGNNVRLKCKNSVSIRRGYTRYKDFSTGEIGNGINLLTRYLGYSMPEAVLALGESVAATGSARQTAAPSQTKNMELPAKAQNYSKLSEHLLTHRKIPVDVIQRLIDQERLYQEERTNKAVFVTLQKDFAELSPRKSLHNAYRTGPDRFWSFEGAPIEPGTMSRAYICESAVDAISLYLLHREQGRDTRSHYCSIAGAANQQAIERIKQNYYAILAVNKGPTGDRCREQNRDIPHNLPKAKSWNEDWSKEQPSEKVLYVLRLEDNCYYIGHSEQYRFYERMNEHFNKRNRKGSNWTILHAPIEIVEQCVGWGNYRDFELKENEKTLEYMRRYGISKVRGGFYTDADDEKVVKKLRNKVIITKSTD